MKMKTTLAALLLAAVMVTPVAEARQISTKIIRLLLHGSDDYARQEQQKKEETRSGEKGPIEVGEEEFLSLPPSVSGTRKPWNPSSANACQTSSAACFCR